MLGVENQGTISFGVNEPNISSRRCQGDIQGQQFLPGRYERVRRLSAYPWMRNTLFKVRNFATIKDVINVEIDLRSTHF